MLCGVRLQLDKGLTRTAIHAVIKMLRSKKICEEVIGIMAIPNMWRTKKQRYSLQGEVCIHCERAVFPPRQICPHCHQPMREQRFSTAAAFDFHTMMPAVAAQPMMVGDD